MHTFGSGSDGASPLSGLLDVNGTLYGTTYSGGSSNDGTVFSVSTSGTEKVLYNFTGKPDGAHPSYNDSLINVNGSLYGTTEEGGASNAGAVFSITTSGTEKVLYSFTGAPDGNAPNGLLNVNGMLYGTTYYGGSGSCSTAGFSGCGTIFSVTTSGKENVLYSFGGASKSDGQWPAAGLLDVNGTLYGTTQYGGANCTAGGGCGTVFDVTTSGKESVLYSFAGATKDGEYPYAPLINVKGTLYGTTQKGGSYGSSGFSYGTLFSITTAGSERVLHDFGQGSDGIYPYAGLLNKKGTLYGTTYGGGSSGAGTVFIFKP